MTNRNKSVLSTRLDSSSHGNACNKRDRSHAWNDDLFVVEMTSEQYSLGKSLNSDWIRGKVKHNHQPAFDKNKVVRAKSACSYRSSELSNGGRSLFFAESDGDEDISETARDFKLTLQLFKRLSQQVREANQHMNRNRIYSYKHHLNNEGISSPALRRSQLAAALSKREIPATHAPYEPITDLGTPVTVSRPYSRQNKIDRDLSKEAQLPTLSRSSSPMIAFVRTPSRTNLKSASSESSCQKRQVKAKTEKELSKADAAAKAQWIAECSDFEDLFIVEPIGIEDMEFRYHDPFPDNWVDETVQDVIFRGSKKKDVFMQRLFELSKVEEETILYERKKENENSIGNHTQPKQLNRKNQRQVGIQTGLPTTRAISAKLPANSLLRSKSPVKVRRSYSAGKISSSVSVHSGDDSTEHIQTLRNSGYKLGQSFVPGSLFPETREVATQFDDQMAQKHGMFKLRSSSHVTQNGDRFHTRSQFCQTCKIRTSSSQKHTCTKNNTTTLQSLRAQYQLKATECYDIVELAKTLEPPCKDQLIKARLKSPTDKLVLKGTVPGKSCFSQRRISLTTDNMMAVKGVSPSNVCQPATGRCKSAKRTIKRR